jgi:hypothetical protein
MHKVHVVTAACAHRCSTGRSVYDPVATDDSELFSRITNNATDIRIGVLHHHRKSIFRSVTTIVDDAFTVAGAGAMDALDLGEEQEGRKKGLRRIKCHGR